LSIVNWLKSISRRYWAGQKQRFIKLAELAESLTRDDLKKALEKKR